MATTGILVCCSLAFALGWHVAQRSTGSALASAAVGAIAGAVCVGLFLVVAGSIRLILPASLEGSGGWQLVLLIVAGLVSGATGGFIGYRRGLESASVNAQAAAPRPRA
jgi:hypothetical protein